MQEKVSSGISKPRRYTELKGRKIASHMSCMFVSVCYNINCNRKWAEKFQIRMRICASWFELFLPNMQYRSFFCVPHHISATNCRHLNGKILSIAKWKLTTNSSLCSQDTHLLVHFRLRIILLDKRIAIVPNRPDMFARPPIKSTIYNRICPK